MYTHNQESNIELAGKILNKVSDLNNDLRPILELCRDIPGGTLFERVRLMKMCYELNCGKQDQFRES